ncbi:MAG: HAD family hydrolase, partial [Phototrophicales bacterium]
MQPKAIIFDMDGTLVDTKEDVHICLNLALKEMG